MSISSAELKISSVAAASASFLMIAVAAACGPTVYPSTRLSDLPTGNETAQTATESTHQASSDVVMYASSGATGAPPPVPPNGDEATPDDSQTPPENGQPAAPPTPERRDQTYILERNDDRAIVRHGWDHNKHTLIGAFESAALALRSPAEVSSRKKGPATEDWNPQWEPHRLELDEAASSTGSQIEFRGSAASEDDIQEFLTRLETIPGFSNVELSATTPVTDGQGIAFQINAIYTLETTSDQPPQPPSQ